MLLTDFYGGEGIYSVTLALAFQLARAVSVTQLLQTNEINCLRYQCFVSCKQFCIFAPLVEDGKWRYIFLQN